jgi:hypothetical protein
MLDRDLIELVNSGQALGFVGSGVSVGAGVESWGALFNTAKIRLSAEIAQGQLEKAEGKERKNDLPGAFDALAEGSSRAKLQTTCREIIENHTSPGNLHALLADWPFRLYATTNYDHLLEDASGGKLVAVGNRGNEPRKVKNNAEGLVWHVHGGSRLADDFSQLVITETDYSEVYPQSNIVGALEALAQVSRFIFVGFGFKDEDLLHLLRTVGRLSHSGRPSFAFLGYGSNDDENHEHQERLLKEYNIRVIPYEVRDRDHSELDRLLASYSPFMLRRSQTLRPASGTPTYDKTASSLRIQAALDLSSPGVLKLESRRRLVRARVLAVLRESEPTNEKSLLADCRTDELEEAEIARELRELEKAGLVEHTDSIRLSPSYREKILDAQAALDLERDQFRQSIQRRVAPSKLSPEGTSRVVTCVGDFFENLCRSRGLGVAQNLATGNEEQASLRAVSLIHDLHEHIAQCDSRTEAHAAIALAVSVLTAPADAERGYLGRLTQAYFGQHLAGGSQRLLSIDLKLISDSTYLLDASVVLCALAPGSKNFGFTSELIDSLRTTGAKLGTTDLFLEEIVEHANWALRLVQRHGENSQEVLDAARCLRGYRPNLFLTGYLSGPDSTISFVSYLSDAFGSPVAKRVEHDQVVEKLEQIGIAVLKFEDWRGFEQELFDRRSTLQREIAKRRANLGTFRHDRQTKAEAEVALIIDLVRSQKLAHPDGQTADAFFASSTRVVEGLPGLARRITILPEGLAQWMWGCDFSSKDHSHLLFEQLLFELAADGVEFVDRQNLLRRFSGVIEAAHADIEAAVRDRRDYLVDKYGPDPKAAFADADPLDIPRFANEIGAEVLARMEEAVKVARRREAEATDRAKLSDKDRQELQKHRDRQKAKHKKQKSKERAAASNPSKRRRNRKKRG